MLFNDELISAIKYRKNHRIPFLTYVYETENDGINPKKVATLWGAGSISGGISKRIMHTLTQSSCKSDVKFVKFIKELVNPADPKLVSFNCRKAKSGVTHSIIGRGDLSIENYAILAQENGELGNPTETEQLYRAFLLAENDSVTNTALNAWNLGIIKVVRCANHVVSLLEKGISVLVSSSEGRDRSIQVNFLSKVLLSSNYRTRMGFWNLIIFEFLCQGYPFRARLSSIGSSPSPIFIQTLHCVKYILSQFPSEFEFNGQFLDEIACGYLEGRYFEFSFDSYNV